MPETPESLLRPADYERRAREVFKAVKRFRELHSRLIQASPSLRASERRAASESFDPAFPRFVSKTEKLDHNLAETYALAHYSPAAEVYGRREVPVATAMSELFELIDLLGAKL